MIESSIIFIIFTFFLSIVVQMNTDASLGMLSKEWVNYADDNNRQCFPLTIDTFLWYSQRLR